MTISYPLQWPVGRPRSQYATSSRFGSRSIHTVTNVLVAEIRRLGGSELVLSSNLRLRRDGLPHSEQRQPDDKGIAVYFTYNKRAMCFACDRWDKIEDNIYAIAMSIEALRGIERWGSGSMLEQAFTGFVALPAPKAPHEVLGVHPDASEERIESAYRQKAKSIHPDRGGDANAMSELNNARDTMKRRFA